MTWQALALVVALVLPIQPPPAPTPFGGPAAAPPGQAAPGQPTPGTPSTDPGTASIKGRVLGQDSGAPLRHAVVQLFSGALHVNLGTMTDGEGRYAFTGLEAGRYIIVASKGGYVRMQYGQKNPRTPGQPVALAAAQGLDRIDFSLLRGGVITGEIVDDAGEPVTGAVVRPMRYGYAGGVRRMLPSGSLDSTDDRGVYRLYGLAPGSYYVMATWNGAMMNTPSSKDHSGFAPTFYPGTADAGMATRVDVQAGQEVSGVAFQLTTTRTATVSGRVIDSGNLPLPQVTVQLRETTSGSSPLIFGISRFALTHSDGSFTMAAVPPGRYTVVAREGDPSGGPIEMGTVPITVAGTDVPGVVVTLSTGATASGSVVIDGGGKAPFAPDSLMVGAMPDLFVGFGGPPSERLDDNWRFRLRGLFGTQRLYVNGLPDGWAIKAVRLNGQDITDSGADFTSQDRVTGLQIVLTNELTDLNGTVGDENDKPLTDYTLIVFPVDRQRWTARSRYIRLDRPDQNGRFEIKGLPPAEYFAVAVASIEPGSQSDPDVLDQLSRNATRFTLREGESKTLTMTVEPPQ